MIRPQKRNNDLFLFRPLDSVVVITFSCGIIFCDYFSVVKYSTTTDCTKYYLARFTYVMFFLKYNTSQVIVPNRKRERERMRGLIKKRVKSHNMFMCY